MGFEQFSLALSHTKIGDEFMEHLENGVIPATKCKECGKKYYPPRADCQKCIDSEMEWIELDTTGEVLAYTQINVPGEHFQNFTLLNQEGFVPIPIGILSLGDDEPNLFGWIVDHDVEDIEVGMELEASVEKVEAERLPVGLIRKIGLAPNVDVENFQLKVPDDFDKEEKVPECYYTIVFK